jgi:hypothetical protein
MKEMLYATNEEWLKKELAKPEAVNEVIGMMRVRALEIPVKNGIKEVLFLHLFVFTAGFYTHVVERMTSIDPEAAIRKLNNIMRVAAVE